MIVITCALPDESRLLLRQMECRRVVPGGVTLGRIGGREVALFHTGMGEARVRQRFTELCRFLERHSARLLLNVGYAGGIEPALPMGQLFLSRNYSSPPLLAAAEQVLGGRVRTGRLVTTATVLETPAAKATLAPVADAIDMETAAVAALCETLCLPMLSLRAVSDTATEELAVPFSICFDAAREKPRPAALLVYLAQHPAKIGGFLRFVRNMGEVRANLTGATLDLIKSL